MWSLTPPRVFVRTWHRTAAVATTIAAATGLAQVIKQEIAGPLTAVSLTKVHSLTSEAQASEVSTVRFSCRARILEILTSRKMVIVYVRVSRGWLCG